MNKKTRGRAFYTPHQRIKKPCEFCTVFHDAAHHREHGRNVPEQKLWRHFYRLEMRRSNKQQATSIANRALAMRRNNSQQQLET